MIKRKLGEYQNTDKRIKWIDCAKFVSMCGVVIDHTTNVVYTNSFLWYAVRFSVSVFVLLSGISARLTYRNSEKKLWTIGTRRLLRFLGQYAVATALVLSSGI